MKNRKTYGKALILDGIIQCTERDEFSYQEMISFLPLCAHENPEKVLIIGGGDGGVAREVSKHPLVKKIVQVEIDGRVVETAKEFLPSMSVGFTSSKLTLKIEDGFEYMKKHQGEFDVIITDSGDPIGPAVNLFTESYFKLLKSALRPKGIICSQMGNIWVDLEHIKETLIYCRKYFPVAKYAYTTIPSYPSGQIGFAIASLDPLNKITIPKLIFNKFDLENLNLKYYSSELHSCAFVLPNFADKLLN